MDTVNNDILLLKRYLTTRDAEAFSEIVGRYQHLVYSVCLRVLGNVSDAEDASQKCFLQLALKAATVKDSLGGWLHRCATRISIDSRRQKCSIQKFQNGYAEQRSSQNGPEEWRKMEVQVDEILEDLPSELREVLIKHYLERRSQTDIASELGLSCATVSRRIDAALGVLRDKLKTAGVVASVAILASFFAQHAVYAAPQTLTSSLGKMAISGVGKTMVTAGYFAGFAAPIVTMMSTTAVAATVQAVDIYHICAVVGGTLFACQFLLSLLGLAGDHDIGLGGEANDFDHDSDHDGHSSLAGKISLRAIIAALTIFGLSGLIATERALGPVLSGVVAIFFGLIAMIAVIAMMKFLRKLQSDGTVSIDQAVGAMGTVYLTIPASKTGIGKVMVNVKNRTMEYLAVSSGAELPTGSKIVVVDIVGADTIEVTSTEPSMPGTSPDTGKTSGGAQ